MEGISGIVRRFRAGREAKGLEHPHFQRRQRAAVMLGEIGGEESVFRLEQRLVDKDTGVRMFATKALGKIFRRTGSEEALEKLGLAVDDENSTVRKVAVDELEASAKAGKPASDAAITHLMRAVDHKDDQFIRFHAVGALGRIGGERVVKPLMAALGHQDRLVRARAVDRLIEVGEKLPAGEKERDKLHVDARALSVVSGHLRGSNDQRGSDSPDFVMEVLANAAVGNIHGADAESKINRMRMQHREKGRG